MTNISDRIIQIIYTFAYRLLRCVWYVFRPSGYGAYVAVWHDNKILIIRNSYKREYTCPSGAIKRGEDEKSAAVRELYEEVNIQVKPNQLQFAGKFFSTHEFKHDSVTFFEVEFSTAPAIKVDNREVIWAEFMPPLKAVSLNLSPHVRAYLEGRFAQSADNDH
jgi:8-oxo-dGTP pyrophosphatase MutT (NUDIX family)